MTDFGNLEFARLFTKLKYKKIIQILEIWIDDTLQS